MYVCYALRCLLIRAYSPVEHVMRHRSRHLTVSVAVVDERYRPVCLLHLLVRLVQETQMLVLLSLLVFAHISMSLWSLRV